MNEEDQVVKVYSYEFYQIRALSDELMNFLCQAKAILYPIIEADFFNHQDEPILKNYFFAFETIIDSALLIKDQMSKVIDAWEQRGRQDN